MTLVVRVSRYEPSPTGYFEKIGKEIKEHNFGSMYSIAVRLIPVFEKLHEIQINKGVNLVGINILLMKRDSRFVKNLPFQYGGIYNVKEYAIPVFCLLTHLGIDLIELDDNMQPILHKELIEAVNQHVQNYIDDNMIYRFSHAKNEIKLLPISYEPIQMHNAPEGKEEQQQHRIDVLQDDECAGEIIRIVVQTNPVFAENFWIPEEE